MLDAVVAVEGDQGGLEVVALRGGRAVALLAQLGQAVLGLERVGLERLGAGRLGGQRHHRFALLPAVGDEIVGHRREHVRQRAEQVAAAVAVAVAGVGAVARRHELAVAHRAGVAALERGQVEVFFLGQQHHLRQFVAEELRAHGLALDLVGLAADGIEERQRVQRIKHRVAAGVAAVAGFHADDGDDDLGRHAGVGFDLGQLFAVAREEGAAFGDAAIDDEDGAVLLPGLHRFGRARHGVHDALPVVGAVEPGFHLRRFQAVLLRGVGDERGALRGVGPRRGGGLGEGGAGQEQQQRSDQAASDSGHGSGRVRSGANLPRASCSKASGRRLRP